MVFIIFHRRPWEILSTYIPGPNHLPSQLYIRILSGASPGEMDLLDLTELVEAFMLDFDPSMFLGCTLESIAIGLFGEVVTTKKKVKWD